MTPDTVPMTQPDRPPPAYGDVQRATTAEVPTDKSVAVALVLTFLFGPLGLLYVTVLGGVLMTLLAIVVAIFTLGFGLILLWPITMVWGAVVAGQQHQKYDEWRIRSMTGR